MRHIREKPAKVYKNQKPLMTDLEVELARVRRELAEGRPSGISRGWEVPGKSWAIQPSGFGGCL